MKTKFFIILVSVFICNTGVIAQNTLNIHQKNGAIVRYLFTEEPIVSYSDNNINLKTKDVEIIYPLNSIEKISFEDNVNNITTSIRTERTNSDVLIYTNTGRLIKRIKSYDGKISIILKEMPQGIYIIKNENTTYKLLKK